MKRTIENKTSLILDLFFCVVFMPILVILGPAHEWFAQWPWFALLACAFMYGCYFLIVNLNVPNLLITKQYVRLAGVIVGLIAGNYLLSWYPLPEMDFVMPTLSEYQTQVRNFGVSMTLWLMFSLVMGYALTISFVKELYDQLLLKKKIEAQRDKAELAMFKAQISPHFMFNTLNSLYSLVLSGSDKTEEAFIKFTELLKYTYVTIEKDKVTIGEEISYIQNYIDLQLLRLNKCTTVDWSYEVDDDKLQVPPLLMLTFVENAFKYGASASQECTISILLKLHDGILEFDTCNSVMRHADEFRKDMPIGLENCRSRLSALYPNRYSLITQEEDGDFKVKLKIDLKE